MIESDIRGRGVTNEAVLKAMRAVPREAFVPEPLRGAAYADNPLPIGAGQTISQPYIVALMTEQAGVGPDDRVLEIGAGSGYQTAVLAEIAREVYTIEIVPELAARAKKTLDRQGYTNVHVRAGDGYRGWPEHAPFDAVLVTAAPDHVPRALVRQLRLGGRLVIPVGPAGGVQALMVLTRTGQEETAIRRTIPVRFVPMTGEVQDEGDEP